MGFSLKKKLEEGIAQIVPFDHASAATVRAKYAAPAPASTIRTANRPQPQVQQQQPQHQNFLQRTVHRITDIPTNVDNWATKSAVGRGAQAVGLGAARSAVGTAQAASGLYDLATPGKGTNRFSKSLASTAGNIDQTAQAEGSNSLLYHGGQLAGDLATFAAGGEALKAAGAIPKVAKFGEIAKPVTRLAPVVENGVTRMVAPLAEKGFAGRVAARTAVNATKPGYQAANLAFTGMQAGKDAAQGRDVSPAGFAGNLALGGLGFPAAGAALHETAAPVVQKAASVLRDNQLIAPSKLNDRDLSALQNFHDTARSGAIMDEDTYRGGVAAAQKAGLQHTDVKGIDDLLGAHRTYDTAVRQRSQKLDDMRTTAIKFTQDHPVGLTSGAVDDEGNRLGMNGNPLKQPAEAPHEKFVKEYADSLRQMESGMTGGQIQPDGNGGYIRTSEHTPFYRDFYAKNGKKPTKMDFVDEARKQLEAGKADSYAQEEYDTLKHTKTKFDTPEIIQARKEAAEELPTHHDMTPERMALREKVGQLLYQQGGHADAERALSHIETGRRADIVLGPPASGKTNIVSPLLEQHKSRLIDSDEAKALLGDVNKAGSLHQESDAIVTDQMLRAAKRGDNIVLPLVGKNPERVRAAAAALKEAGYDLHLHYNHLDPEKTAQRAVSRFNETGRFVDPHYVYNEVGLKPKAAYDTLKKDENLFSTYQAYDNDVPKGEKPRLTEQGRLSGGPTEAGRPLRGNAGEQAAGAEKPLTPEQHQDLGELSDNLVDYALDEDGEFDTSRLEQLAEKFPQLKIDATDEAAFVSYNGKDIHEAQQLMAGLQERRGASLQTNPDGTVTLYHGTNGESADAIKKGNFAPDSYFSASPEEQVGGVNGASYYGDNVAKVTVDPRDLEYYTLGEFTLKNPKGIKAVDWSGDTKPAPLARSDSSEPMTSLKDALAAKVSKLAGKPVETAEKAAKSTKKVRNDENIPIPGDMPIDHSGPEKRTRFTEKTVQNSDEVSQAVKDKVDASYTSDTMKNAAQRTNDFIDENGEEDALNQTFKELNKRRGTASRDTLDRAIELATRHDLKGGAANEEIAERLYNLVGEHGSASGQQSQILARIARRSPAGLRNKAFRDLEKAGVNLDGPKGQGIKKEIQGHIDAIKSLPDGPEKDWAIAVLQKSVLKHMPQSVGDQLTSLWKAGLLSGVRTHGGNIVSNATFGTLHKASDPGAALVDQGLSLITGARTKTSTRAGLLRGTGQGIKSASRTLKTGIDPRQVGDKYEQHAELNFKNKYIQNAFGKPANGIFRLLGAADQPTYYAALKNSLYDQAKADGLNQGKHSGDLLAHMDKMVQNPTEQMVEIAEKDANKSVLAYDTIGSKAVQGIHKGIDNLPGASEAGKNVAHAVVNVLAPFVRVPSAFISRTIDFTPFGVGKEVFSQVAHKKFDQRALSEAISEGITGTGVVALGIALSQNKLISGDYPKGDQKEAARWKAEGITPNSVKLGNTWVSLNYLGPVGLLFNAGHQMEQNKGESASTKTGVALAGIGQGLMGQSFLQGFSGFSDAIQDPERNAKSFINSEASSIVPSISNDAANLGDDSQRVSDTVPEAIKGRIPGLRESNDVKTDVYGNPLKQPTTGLNKLSPLRPSDARHNPVIDEVDRLHNVDTNNKDLQVTPTPVARTVTVDSKQVNLTNEQRRALQTAVGQRTQNLWGEIIKSDVYKDQDDTGKAKMLSNARTDAAALATREYITGNKLATYSKPATNRQAGLASGTIDPSAYVASASGSGGKSYVKGDDRGTALISHVNSMSSSQQKDWASKPLDSKYQDLYDRSKAIVPSGLPDLPQTNGTLKAYATYLQAKTTAKNNLELNKAKKTFLKDAYSGDLSDGSNDLLGSGYTVGEKIDAIDSGDISKDDLTSAVEYDNFLLSSGLSSSAKISNKVRRAAGLDDAPKTSGSSSSSSGGSKKSKLTYDLFSKGVDPIGYNKKLRELVKDATLKKETAKK